MSLAGRETHGRRTNGAANALTGAPGQPGLKQLGLEKVTAGRDALRLPDHLPLKEWLAVGEQISLISNASSWWLGDWLVYGQDRYPNRYRDAMARSSLEYQTLRNYAWVARRFPPSRRRDGLSFQHHFEVAALPADQQAIWLLRAEEFRWSKAELRRQLRSGRDRPSDALEAGRSPLQVDLATQQFTQWTEAARHAGMELTDWVVSVVDRAAKDVLRAS